MYISSYTKLDGNGNTLTSNTGDVTRIDGGATDGSYTSVIVTVADKKYKIYKYGEYTTTTVTNGTSATIDQGDEQYYDVTYYVDEQTGIASYSGKYGGASNESNPSVSGGGSSLQLASYSQIFTLLSQPSFVTYSSQSSNTDIQLGDANSQTFTFTHGQWNLISFYSLDTSKTTIQTLFGSIPTGYSKLIIFDQAYNQFSYESGVWSPSTDEDINYDSGYYVKVLFAGASGTVNWTITGSEFTYLKTDLTTGFNFISWPFAASSDASALLDTVKNGGTVTDTFWSYLRSLFTPSGAAITGPQTNQSAQYTNGDITLQPGSAYIVNVSSAFDIDNGTISTLTPAQIKENNIKSIVPILTGADIVNDIITIDLTGTTYPTILTNGTDETENRKSRKLFMKEFYTNNKVFLNGIGSGKKVLMSKDHLLGSYSSLTSTNIKILNSSNQSGLSNHVTTFDIGTLDQAEGLYLYMEEANDEIRLITPNGDIQFVRNSNGQYNIYEDFTNNGAVDQILYQEGYTSSYDGFKYFLGSVVGENTGSGSGGSAGPAVPICFPAGTLVETNKGEVAIEMLNPDVHKIRGKRIVAITETSPKFKYIIRIEKDALVPNVPSRRTEISRDHEILYKGKMIRSEDLVDKCEGVYRIKYHGKTLYNVLMEKHDKMMINNLICETLHPNNIMAKICSGEYTTAEKNKIYKELNDALMNNDLNACKKLYASLK